MKAMRLAEWTTPRQQPGWAVRLSAELYVESKAESEKESLGLVPSPEITDADGAQTNGRLRSELSTCDERKAAAKMKATCPIRLIH